MQATVLQLSGLTLEPPKSGSLLPSTPNFTTSIPTLTLSTSTAASSTAVTNTANNTTLVKNQSVASTGTTIDKKDDDLLEESAVKLKTNDGVDPLDATAVVEKKSNSIYVSAKSFEDLKLPNFLVQAVYKNKYVTPSKIQAEALPVLLSSKKPNFVGQAHNGSGKTAAYGLALLASINLNVSATQVIVVVPVRELAIQVYDALVLLAQFEKRITIRKAIPQEEGGKIVEHVVVATPGTLISKLKQGAVDSKSIHMLVVDEADQMISRQGLGDQTLQIKNKLPKTIQIVLFSSTFPKEVASFANVFAPQAEWIAVKREQLSLDCIKQFSMQVTSEDVRYKKLTEFFAIFPQLGQVIIFVGTIKTAKELTNKLRRDGCSVSLIYGQGMQPKERDAVMSDFRSAKTSILITTNVISRGIDVLSVNLVINYDLPVSRGNKPDPEVYLHRIGRSGRFGRKGVAINFICNAEQQNILNIIQSHFASTIVALSSSDLESVERVLLAALDRPVQKK